MKILIAYYSKGGSTEKLAQLIKKEFEGRGHSVEVERVRPLKEHGFLGWWHIRMFKGDCDILPPKIQDVSGYDLVCIGSPNWTRISLPVARYLKEIKGLKYKNVGLFATAALIPQIEWYILSAYLFELTFSAIIDRQGARFINTLLLSSVFKKWGVLSDYGEKAIKNFCHKLEAPVRSLKEYFLEQKELESARLLVVLFSFFLLLSFLFQVISAAIEKEIFTWQEYQFLFLIGFFAYFSMLTILSGRVNFSLIKYIAIFSLIAVLTIIILFLTPAFGRPIILGYVLIFVLISFFRDVRVVAFGGLMALLSYGYLFVSFPDKSVFRFGLDIFSILISAGMVSFVTQNLQKHYVTILESQDEIEAERATLEVKIDARTRELKELSEGLEAQVKERTLELQEKIGELERFNKLSVGRELKMVELKEEIKKLKEELEKIQGRK